MSTLPLTKKQKHAAIVIQKLTEANGWPPTGAELAEALNLTTGGAYSLIRGLMARGHATKVRCKPHTLQLVEKRA
jgi:SOS-response transcriptional repressor LexA